LVKPKAPNAFGDLSDLPRRMRPRVPRIEFDPADRHVLDMHAAVLEAEIGRATPGGFEVAPKMGPFAD
jgi:hypothetical protein